MTDFLRINNISKQFEGHKALDNVNFNVKKGTIFGLLGPNGAGKTTLIRIINRIFEPDTGNIFINNEKLSPSDIKIIGYLPEERGLYKKMKVGEQIIFFAKLKGLSSNEAKKEADFWMKRLDISSWWDKKIEELSKGMQQKIQFVITVLHNPKLLIFDEPFSGFDPINVDLIKKQILWLKEKGITIIFSTHNMASVEEICEYIVLINKGKKLLEGKLEEIKDNFSENIYEIGFKNKPENKIIQNFKLTKQKNKNTKNLYRISLPENNSNSFLENMCKYAEIKSFNKITPKLHDIFVSVVNKNQ